MKSLAPFAMLLLSGGVLAQTGGPVFDYGVGFRGEFQSNITQDPVDEIDDYMLVPFVQLGLRSNGANVDASFDGQAEYVKFGEDIFDDELRGTFNSSVLWRISEQRFHWVFEDNLARAPVDILNRDTPNNVQQINTLSTGPELIFRFGGADSLVLAARYRNFLADGRDDDFDGVGASANWIRQTSPNQQFGLRLERSSVSFDTPSILNTDYDRDQIALTFDNTRNIRGARHQFGVEAGYMRIQFDESGRDDSDTPLLRMTYDIQNADGTQFALSLAKEIGDISTDLSNNDSAPRVDNILQNGATGEPFEREQLSVSWSKAWDRLSLALNASFDQQDFELASLDQEAKTAGVNLDYRMRPLLTLRGGVNWVDQEFSNVGQNDEFLESSIGLSYQRTRRINYDLIVGYSDRDSTTPSQVSDNTSLIFRFTYRR